MADEERTIVGLYKVRILEPDYRSAATTPYQVTTMDYGTLEVLYEGRDLEAASRSALEHSGKATLYHYRYDGSIRPMVEYRNGQAVKGWAYS